MITVRYIMYFPFSTRDELRTTLLSMFIRLHYNKVYKPPVVAKNYIFNFRGSVQYAETVSVQKNTMMLREYCD